MPIYEFSRRRTCNPNGPDMRFRCPQHACGGYQRKHSLRSIVDSLSSAGEAIYYQWGEVYGVCNLELEGIRAASEAAGDTPMADES